jgi:shikimate kinase
VTDLPQILLMGLRGAGKSSVARRLAERTGRPPIDLDDVTPALCGCPDVAAAWALWGQRAFRNAEARAMTAVLFNGRFGARGHVGEVDLTIAHVVALGGGTPTAPGADEAILLASELKRAVAIYLRATPASLRERLESADNRHRPSLTGVDALEEIERVFEERDPLYVELAGLVIETAGLAEEDVVGRIIEHLGEE